MAILSFLHILRPTVGILGHFNHCQSEVQEVLFQDITWYCPIRNTILRLTLSLMLTGHKVSSSVKYTHSGVFCSSRALRQKVRVGYPVNTLDFQLKSLGLHLRNRGKAEKE